MAPLAEQVNHLVLIQGLKQRRFPFIRDLGNEGSSYAVHMKDARFTIPTPGLLAKVVDMLDHVPMFKHDAGFKLPYQDNLSALIHEPSFRQGVGDALFTKARLIKDLGNLAVHSTKKVLPTDALTASRELFHFCYRLARSYGRGQRPEPGLSFQSSLVPPASGAAPQSVEQLQKLSAQLQEKDEKLGPSSVIWS